jgi:TRAP-type C4-dicarboxylate transport system substrate-binding protein
MIVVSALILLGGKMRIIKMIIAIVVMVILVHGQTPIKFATLAPEGSTWMNVMKEFSQAVKDKTNGQLKFKIYPGGVSGDELVVLRKIRVGQLHSAGFTGVGLGEILPEVRIMDSPFLFNNHDEVDYVKSKLFEYFAQKFEEKGFILLGWAEVGFVYIFTNQPVQSTEDMSGVKMWMWEGDPIAEATFKSFNISPIPLSVTDVLTSLQTNLINGVYISPYGLVALQWHTRVKYMLNLRLANSNGAVLLSKKKFAKLNNEQQAVLRNLAREYFGKLTQLSREDNMKSLELIKKEGIQLIENTNASQLGKFNEAGKMARRTLIDRLYDEQFLTKVESLVKEYRTKTSSQTSQ